MTISIEKLVDISATALAQYAKTTLPQSELDNFKSFLRVELKRMDHDENYVPNTKALIGMLERSL